MWRRICENRKLHFVSKDQFESAAGRQRLSSEQTDSLWNELATNGAPAGFNLPNLSYYFGALVVMVGMTLLVPKAWEKFGGAGLFLIAAVYAAGLGLAGKVLWFEKGYRVPGGLLITVAVCMAPLAIYGIERQTGIWPQGDPGAFADFYPWIRGSWFAMETGTIAAGLIALRYVRFFSHGADRVRVVVHVDGPDAFAPGPRRSCHSG